MKEERNRNLRLNFLRDEKTQNSYNWEEQEMGVQLQMFYGWVARINSERLMLKLTQMV